MSTETNKYIDSLLNTPKAYKNNAYGDLNKLYDFAKNNDLSKMTDEEKKSFYFDLETLKNRLIKFVETKYLKPDRKDLLIHRIKYLYKKVYSSDFLNSDLIIEVNNKILKLKDVFDFELEPEIGNEQVIDPNAQKLILDAIIEVKEQIEQTTEKSGKREKPEKTEKELKDLINKSHKWNNDEIKTLKKELLNKFQDEINKAYDKGGKGSKEVFNYVILYLIKNRIIDDKNFKDTECVSVFEKLFFNQKVESFYPNYMKFKRETGLEINKLNTTNYKEIFEPKISEILNNHTFLNNHFTVD